jgi:hypothetical protein
MIQAVNYVQSEDCVFPGESYISSRRLLKADDYVCSTCKEAVAWDLREKWGQYGGGE